MVSLAWKLLSEGQNRSKWETLFMVANQNMPRYSVTSFEEAEWAIKAAASIVGVNNSGPISFAIARG